ncbi:MAG: transcriptional regulator [Actinobacteria bacterium]|nr:transcriptional regulator [Actinomycetota bacterium]
MSYLSAPGDLALHGVRVLGFPAASRVAARYGLDAGLVEEALRDFEASGWVRYLSFGETAGWSLTDAGRTENERRLAAELGRAGARDTVARAHASFLPLNRRLGDACTKWQIRPTSADPMAFNDHADWRWDERVLQALAAIGRSFQSLCEQLSGCLARFGGYAGLYSSALSRAQAGQRDWVDGPDRDSCHIVWIQFHEDLLATLGMPRGTDT